jgi:small GTP-binding protein
MSGKETMKMVIVGDGSIGKTCLLAAIKDPDKDVTSGAYNATVAENVVEEWELDGEKVDVDVWDTAGQEAFSMLRKMAYPSSHVVVLGFSMTAKDSLKNITEGKDSWVNEIRNTVSGFESWILVGTKYDLWETEHEKDDECVTMEACYQVAEELKAKHFFVTSALTKLNVKEVQDAILRTGVANKNGKDTPAWKRPASPKPAAESKPAAAEPKPPAGGGAESKPAPPAKSKPSEVSKEKKPSDSGCCVLL